MTADEYIALLWYAYDDSFLSFQFFNNCLMLGKTSESEVSDHIYTLIYELNQIAPSVLLAVLPQLEYKLKVNF